MEIKNIIKWWKFPKSTIINRNLPKTQIYPHMKKVNDKQFLQDNVQSIYILANFKTDNIRIPVFESEGEFYQEIQFLYIKIKEKGNSEKIFKILTGLIPYHLVVLIEELEHFTLYTGHFERLSTGYLRLKSTYSSPPYKYNELEKVLEKLSISELPRQNLKVLYNGLRDVLATELTKNQYGDDVGEITGDKKDKIDKLNNQINQLKNQIKKECQINRRIDMQMRLKKLKKELSKLLDNSWQQ